MVFNELPLGESERERARERFCSSGVDTAQSYLYRRSALTHSLQRGEILDWLIDYQLGSKIVTLILMCAVKNSAFLIFSEHCASSTLAATILPTHKFSLDKMSASSSV